MGELFQLLRRNRTRILFFFAAIPFGFAAQASPAQPVCTLAGASHTTAVGSQLRLSWDSTDASFGAWDQNEAASVLGLSGDGVGPRGWLDVAVANADGAITPTLRIGDASPAIRRISTVNLASFSNAIGIDVAGNYAYIVDAGIGHQFDVVDISTPTAPVVVGTLSDLFRLNGAFNVKSAGRYAYVTAGGSSRLEVIDTSRPTVPAIVGEIADARLAGARGLFLAGRYAYVAANQTGALHIIDIANPIAPVLIGSITDPARLSGADSIVVDGRYAYVTAGTTNSLVVVDVSDAAAPVIVANLTDVVALGNPKELAVRDGFAYVAGLASNSLAIVDISRPSAPELVSFLADAVQLAGAKNLYLSGDYLYVTANLGARLTIVRIADPHAPAIVASFSDPVNLSNARGVAVVGSNAFVAAGDKLNAFGIQDGFTANGSCSVSIAVTGASPPPSATISGVIGNGSTTIGGTATGVTNVTLILYLSYDTDMVAYTNVQIPVINGHWSIALPLYDATYQVEVHVAASKPSAATFLAGTTLTVRAGQFAM
jgi:hypothetical protein